MPTVLSIGGSDSSACSGTQADLRTIAAMGLHGASVITAVTAQDSSCFLASNCVEHDKVRSQLIAVGSNMDIAAIKVGMLGTRKVIQVVADWLRSVDAPVVLDPVLASTTGGSLLDSEALDALVDTLAPLATLVTPNLHEAARLTGVESIVTPDGARCAGEKLLKEGCKAALIKGGHFQEHRGQDLLVQRSGVKVWSDPPLKAPHSRGTGCVLSTAIASYLALGCPLIEAIERARIFLRRALPHGYPVGDGPGPLDVFVQGTRRRNQALGPRAVGRVHVITDTTLQSRFSHWEIASMAAEAGADVIQYRDKACRTTRDYMDIAARVISGANQFGAQCIVNDRADVATATEAAGVHLGSNDLNPRLARRIVGPHAQIGATANNLEQVLALSGAPIDYIGVGPIYGTTSKANPAPPVGLDMLKTITAASTVPIIAIGGIEPRNIPALMEAGAHGVAVLSAVTCAKDPVAATNRFSQAMDLWLKGGR